MSYSLALFRKRMADVTKTESRLEVVQNKRNNYPVLGKVTSLLQVTMLFLNLRL